MLFDTHAHYDAEQFDEDRDEILKGLKNFDVGYVINPGCDVKSSLQVVELCNTYDFLYGAVGIHPECALGAKDEEIEILRALSRHKKIVAIGEIGLDYYWKEVPRETQKKWLHKQMQLAKEENLPVIIHDREAHNDCLEILKQYDVRGVYHCYSGSVEMAREILKMGYYVSFTGVLTFNNAKKAIEVLKELPLERIFLETDSPYMAPVPHRGSRNDSSYICEIAKKISEIKNIPYEEVVAITTKNAKDFFAME